MAVTAKVYPFQLMNPYSLQRDHQLSDQVNCYSMFEMLQLTAVS